MNRNQQINLLMEAVKHYQKTGQHKQVSIQYNPENRTRFEFDSWKDIRISSAGKFYVVGKDNRYNLKQYTSQFAQHPRAYRLDRLVVAE
jgi:hypothetical protein